VFADATWDWGKDTRAPHCVHCLGWPVFGLYSRCFVAYFPLTTGDFMNATLAVLGLSGGELVLVLVVILVLFGAKRIPEFAKGIGKGITEFKKASREVTDEIERAVDEPPPAPPPKTPPTKSNAENPAQPSPVPKT
jgi:sec-independent protein translocase protein TatA